MSFSWDWRRGKVSQGEGLQYVGVLSGNVYSPNLRGVTVVDCDSSPTHLNRSKMTVLKELVFLTGNFLEAWLQLLKK